MSTRISPDNRGAGSDFVRDLELPSLPVTAKRFRYASWINAFVQAAAILVIILYPAAVYYGLIHYSVRKVAPLLLLVFLLSTALRVGAVHKDRKLIQRSVGMLLGIAVLLVSATIYNEPGFVLALPVLINVVLFLGFAGSLRGGVSLIERLALLRQDDLSEEELLYCRRLTVIWSAFFVFNGGIAMILSVWAPFSWWALYNGLIAYVLIGLLGGSEYVYRKHRFRRYGSGWHDRIIRFLLPSRM
jgi:uncharacterized membrane protein